jgi:hypothetical protein
MAAAAHTKGGFGGVPQKVGREFNKADQHKRHLVKGLRSRSTGGTTQGTAIGGGAAGGGAGGGS